MNGRSTLFILIGPAGCGKSTLAEELAWAEGSAVISSDGIREELYGNEAIQGDPAEVFEIAHSRIWKALDDGAPIIVFDATNLVPKYRATVLSMVGDRALKIGMVYTGDLETCLERNNARSRKVPEAVVNVQYGTLHRPGYFPSLMEGFDMLMGMEADHAYILG